MVVESRKTILFAKDDLYNEAQIFIDKLYNLILPADYSLEILKITKQYRYTCLISSIYSVISLRSFSINAYVPIQMFSTSPEE